jgi:hypothetical protein
VLYTVENHLQIEVSGAVAFLDQHIFAIVSFDMVNIIGKLLPQYLDHSLGNGIFACVVGHRDMNGQRLAANRINFDDDFAGRMGRTAELEPPFVGRAGSRCRCNYQEQQHSKCANS